MAAGERALIVGAGPGLSASLARLCARDGITINIFLIQNWNQSHEDLQFAYRVAETTKGRVIFTAGKDLDRYVIWDYLQRKKQIVS